MEKQRQSTVGLERQRNGFAWQRWATAKQGIAWLWHSAEQLLKAEEKPCTDTQRHSIEIRREGKAMQ
jgi:hypothetical protein|nr:MAG TPA: hypothetical protein [Caudoviricetes sp.]